MNLLQITGYKFSSVIRNFEILKLHNSKLLKFQALKNIKC